MASSLYDGLDDAIESENGGGGGSRSSWVLGRTSNISSSPSKGGSTGGATGIARLVASATTPTSHTSSSPGNSSSMMLMQSHMAAKRAHGRRGPNEVSRSTVAPVVDLQRRHGGGGSSGEGSYRFNQMTGKMERVSHSSSRSSNNTGSTVLAATGLLYGEPSLPFGVPDEYNPLFPNDYEELARHRREKRKADERAMSANRAAEASNNGGGGTSSGMCRRPVLSDSGSDSDDGDSSSRRGGKRGARGPPPASRHSHSRNHGQTDGGGGRGVGSGVAIAPPSSLLEDVVVTPDLSHPPPDLPPSTTADISNSQDAQVHGGKFGINPVAAKMMANMGYCVGKGLGKDGQGMSSALVVEKTSRRGGKIIHERDRKKTHQQQQQQQTGAVDPQDQAQTPPEISIPANATTVVLLRNMCGPGEVDDDLEPETAEECAKYGPVVTCMIFELPDAPDDEAVRIFVEFVSEESAVKAVCDLNGRFFGGRVVKAGFYNAERFRNLDLNDPPISN